MVLLLSALLILVGIFALLAIAFHAARAFSACTDKQTRFERTYATVSQHVVEFAYWCCYHARVGLNTSGGRSARAVRACAALLLMIATLAIPVAAIVATGDSTVQSHGLAAGVGALVWGLVLETSSLTHRVKAFSNRIVQPELWLWAILLCIADVAVLMATAWAGFGEVSIKAAMIGVSYVAAADLISTYVGFVLCPWPRYPLAGP